MVNDKQEILRERDREIRRKRAERIRSACRAFIVAFFDLVHAHDMSVSGVLGAAQACAMGRPEGPFGIALNGLLHGYRTWPAEVFIVAGVWASFESCGLERIELVNVAVSCMYEIRVRRETQFREAVSREEFVEGVPF